MLTNNTGSSKKSFTAMPIRLFLVFWPRNHNELYFVLIIITNGNH